MRKSRKLTGNCLEFPGARCARVADLPRPIHTVPITRPPASPIAPLEPGQPTQAPAARVVTEPDIDTSHAQPVNVCARYGGHRIDFMRGHHAMWRCIYPRHR